jgi:hypothetical protein
MHLPTGKGDLHVSRHLALLAALLAAAGCVHAPKARQLAGGETLILETVEFQVPSEPGWFAFHQTTPTEEELKLVHLTPAGAQDRSVTITERPIRRMNWEPARFLEWVRPADPLDRADTTFTPTAAEAYSLDGRFGPHSVKGTLRFAPRYANSGIPPGTLEHRAFVASDRRPPRYVLASAKTWTRDPADPPSAAPPLDGLRLRPAGAPADAASRPDVEGRAIWAAALGGAVAEVRGHRMTGATLRLDFSGESWFPSTREGVGANLTLRTVVADGSGYSAATATVGAGLHAVRGRVRYGAALDLGVASSAPWGGKADEDFAVGGRVFGSYDLWQAARKPVAAALELELSATTPGFYVAALNLVARLPAPQRVEPLPVRSDP